MELKPVGSDKGPRRARLIATVCCALALLALGAIGVIVASPKQEQSVAPTAAPKETPPAEPHDKYLQEVARELRPRIGEVVACLEAADMAPKIVRVQFRIGSAGQVHGDPMVNGIGKKGAECVAKQVKAWNFPGPGEFEGAYVDLFGMKVFPASESWTVRAKARIAADTGGAIVVNMDRRGKKEKQP